MNHSTRSAAIPIALAFFALPSPALPMQVIPVQPVLAQGMFSNFAVGMHVSGVASPNPLLIRAPGVNGGVPVAWSPGGFTAASPLHPDYTTSALTSYWASGLPTPAFGGISTGGEVMPTVNASGQLQMIASNWYMLAVTVEEGSIGTPGSVIEMQRQNGTRSVSADIFSYYAVGSLGINAALVNRAFLESSREQLNVGAGAAIQNFDYGMGIISIDPQARAGSMFPVRNCFYFTLTKDWLAQAPANFQLGGQDANAATVYAMRWDPTQTPAWSAPVIAFDDTDLFPGVDTTTIEIDALSVDKGSGPWDAPSRAVLSLTPASDPVANPYSQLLVYQRYMTTGVQTLRTDPAAASGQSWDLAVQLGVGEPGDPANITGTCGGDPIERYNIYSVVAIGTDQLAHGPGTLGLSAVRRCAHPTPPASSDDAVAEDSLHVQLTGLRYYPHMYGFLRFYTESPVPPSGGSPGPRTPWGAPILIDYGMTQRNALDFQVPLPCSLADTHFRFSAEIVGLDLTPGFPITPLRDSWVLTIGQ